MRMYVKQGKKRIGLCLPTGLILNRFTIGFAIPALKKQGITVTKAQLLDFLRVLHQYRRAHKAWVLAEAELHNGEKIFVKL